MIEITKDEAVALIDLINQHNSRLHHGVSLRQRNKKRTNRLYAGA